MIKKRYILYIIPILFFLMTTNVYAGIIEPFDFPWYIDLMILLVLFTFNLLAIYILLVISYVFYKKYVQKKYKDKKSKHFIVLKIFKVILIILAIPIIIGLFIRFY